MTDDIIPLAFLGIGGYLAYKYAKQHGLIDPATPTTLYAGINYVWPTGSGVFKSTNGGDNWSAVNTGLTNLYIPTLTIGGKVSSHKYVTRDGQRYEFVHDDELSSHGCLCESTHGPTEG